MLFANALFEDLQINLRSPNKGIYFQILKYFIQEINVIFIISTYNYKFNVTLQIKKGLSFSIDIDEEFVNKFYIYVACKVIISIPQRWRSGL